MDSIFVEENRSGKGRRWYKIKKFERREEHLDFYGDDDVIWTNLIEPEKVKSPLF